MPRFASRRPLSTRVQDDTFAPTFSGAARFAGPRPRLLVACRAFGVQSEIWMRRQIAAFESFDPAVLCWQDVRERPDPTDAPVHTLGTEFDRMEPLATRWWRTVVTARSGNHCGAAGAERSRIEAVIRHLSPAVMLCHFGVTALRLLPIAETLGLPLVAYFHGYDISSRLRNRYYRWSLRRNAKRFAESIIVGSHQRRVLTRLGVPENQITQIPCGAPTEEFLPKTNYRSEVCRFITVSRLVPAKGVDFTLRAFARARQARADMELHIVGAGPLEPRLRDLAAHAKLGSSVVFHGEQPASAVRTLLAAADVFVQHSLDHDSGWTEGFGVSIAEASATGLPVLVTGAGGIGDQISDGENGLLAPQRDIPALADLRLRLAADDALRRRLGEAGRRRVCAEFDSTMLAHRLEQRLLAIATERSAAARRANRAAHA